MTSQHKTIVSNVLIIGSGAAGLRAAIAAHQAGVEVLVVGKRIRKDAHTILAAGGMNAAMGNVDQQDSWQWHFADIYQEAYLLASPRMVEILTQEAPAVVRELADWGCNFALTADGKLDPAMKVNFMISLVPPGDLQVTGKPLPKVSNELAEWVLEEKDLSLQGRLLE